MRNEKDTMHRKVTKLQLIQMITAWSSDYYLGGSREFVVDISEDGREFTVEPYEDQKVYKV